MKTIIEGNRDIRKAYKYFKCRVCGWAGKAEKGEYNEGDQREPGAWVRCPCCGINTADEVTNTTELNRLIQLDCGPVHS